MPNQESSSDKISPVDSLISQLREDRFIIKVKKYGPLYIDYLSVSNHTKLLMVVTDVRKINKEALIDKLISVLTYRIDNRDVPEEERGKCTYELTEEEKKEFAELFLSKNKWLETDWDKSYFETKGKVSKYIEVPREDIKKIKDPIEKVHFLLLEWQKHEEKTMKKMMPFHFFFGSIKDSLSKSILHDLQLNTTISRNLNKSLLNATKIYDTLQWEKPVVPAPSEKIFEEIARVKQEKTIRDIQNQKNLEQTVFFLAKISSVLPLATNIGSLINNINSLFKKVYTKQQQIAKHNTIRQYIMMIIALIALILTARYSFLNYKIALKSYKESILIEKNLTKSPRK